MHNIGVATDFTLDCETKSLFLKTPDFTLCELVRVCEKAFLVLLNWILKARNKILHLSLKIQFNEMRSNIENCTQKIGFVSLNFKKSISRQIHMPVPTQKNPGKLKSWQLIFSLNIPILPLFSCYKRIVLCRLRLFTQRDRVAVCVNVCVCVFHMKFKALFGVPTLSLFSKWPSQEMYH